MFIAGVFWGKKSILEISSAQLTSHSFADTLYDTFYGLASDKKTSHGQSTWERNDGLQMESVARDETEDVSQKELSEETDSEGAFGGMYYYAQLAAYNTAQEAQECAQKLIARGMSIRVLERLSETGAGKACTWYAVVTEATPHKGDLIGTINRNKHLLITKKIIVNTLNNEQKDLLFGKERRMHDWNY